MQEENPWQYAYLEKSTPELMDTLWADGWRHFGTYFFRDTLNFVNDQPCLVTPLRINLTKFSFSKKQKKFLKQVENIRLVYQPAVIDEEKEILFHKHITRFKTNVPNSIYDFLSENPAEIPCQTIEVDLYDSQNYLYGVSFMDVGKDSLSSVYAMFDPDYSALRPGIHTLLAEIQYGIKHQKKYLYTGYAYREASHYDYKKKFSGVEYYDWKGNWRDLDFE